MSTRRTPLSERGSPFDYRDAPEEGKKSRNQESKTGGDSSTTDPKTGRSKSPSVRWRKANWLVREDRFYDLKLLAAKRRTSLYKLLEEALAPYIAKEKERQNRA